MTSKADYTGRFAPSPSGPLHFGSLVSALASYLDARFHRGRWLLRMEDLDPAREPPEAMDNILRALDQFGLHWDGDVLFQSQRLTEYKEALQQLREQGLIYKCDCTRLQIQAMGGVYDNRCRNRSDFVTGGAERVQVSGNTVFFTDAIQGPQQQQLLRECGDFVLRRKDGLIAYQLAVVVDDAFQNITDIVRGSDLLDSTPRQIYLQQKLNFLTPHYAHVPVAVNEFGQKLSKQHFADPLDTSDPSAEIYRCLRFLGQRPPLELVGAPSVSLLSWAITHWDIQAVPKLANIPLDSLN